ncbi:MAG: STAS domain-containing protein, partial [Candidatus Omnitrophota bacterium]
REELKKEMEKLLKGDNKKFIIDLTKVGFISSLVLATLVFFAKEVREREGAVKLTGVSTEAYSIFQLTQLDKVFEIFETEQEALETLK